jgi:tetratricopeptide (TPR) repeat protein
VLNDRGETAGAKSAYQRALSLAESVGAKRDVTGALTNLGNVLANAENLAESTQSYERAMKVAEEIGDRTEVFRAQSNIGANFMVQGDFAKARTASEFALQTARELGDKSGAANTLINLGTISYGLGDLSTARQRLSNALEIARQLGLRSLVASASAALGDVQLASDEISAARTSYQDSLNIRTQIGEKNGIASSLLQLAIADLEQGTAVAAEEKARQAIQQFHDLEDLDQEAGGRAVLARVLITQKKTTEAQAEISAAEKLVPRDPTTKILLLIARSDVKANANTENKALEGLGQAIQSAKAIQFVPGELEARAARARVLAMTGQVAQARIERSQVIADATRHGFRLLARKTEMSAHP